MSGQQKKFFPPEQMPMPVMPLEYDKNRYDPLLPVIRVVAIFVMVLGAIRVAASIFFAWGSLARPFGGLGVRYQISFWPFVMMAIAGLQTGAGIAALLGKENTRLLRIWGWSDIGIYIINFALNSLYYYQINFPAGTATPSRTQFILNEFTVLLYQTISNMIPAVVALVLLHERRKLMTGSRGSMGFVN